MIKVRGIHRVVLLAAAGVHAAEVAGVAFGKALLGGG